MIKICCTSWYATWHAIMHFHNISTTVIQCMHFCYKHFASLPNFSYQFILLLRPRERWRSIVMSASVCVSLYVCVCLSVCLSASISLQPHARSLPKFFVHVVYRRSSVIVRRGCAITMERGNFVVFPPLTMHCIAVWISLRWTDFAYIYLFIVKSYRIQFLIIKGHNNVTSNFEITRKVNEKRNEEIWRLMGRTTDTHDAVVIVTVVTVRCRRK